MEFSVVVGAPADWSMDDLLFVSQAATVPTLNEWGIIVFMVLAGLGSLYYLKKIRVAR